MDARGLNLDVQIRTVTKSNPAWVVNVDGTGPELDSDEHEILMSKTDRGFPWFSTSIRTTHRGRQPGGSVLFLEGIESTNVQMVRLPVARPKGLFGFGSRQYESDRKSLCALSEKPGRPMGCLSKLGQEGYTPKHTR